MDADDNTEGSDDANVSVFTEEETDVGKGDSKNNSDLGSTGGILLGVVVAVLLILISVVAVIAVIVCILRRKTQKTTASPKQVKINQLKPVARPSGQNPVYEEIHRSDTSTYISHTDP